VTVLNFQTIVMAMVIAFVPNVLLADPVTVIFPDGDRLTGEVVSQSGDTVVIRHAVLGEVTVPASMVSMPTKEEVVTTATSAAKEASAAAVTAEDPAKVSVPDPNPWTGSISLAATASRAANDTTNIRIGGELHRKSDTGQFDLTGSWYWNQNNGKTIDNDMLIRAAQEWFVTDSRWLYFAQGTWQYDQFEDWGHRVSPYGGIGRKLYERDDLELTLKVGAGGTWEYKENRVDPQLLFEANTSWQINDRQSLAGFMSIAPDPLDWGNYLATISIDWKYKLGADTLWSLNLGVRDIYNSQPSGSSTANDFKAYAGLSMEF
jgi:putative salt-induced outer membrane protein YdiY